MPTFYEFFAGGGMARSGLGEAWDCVFANDFSEQKAMSYRANWGGDHLVVEDINKITSANLPGHADLAWASFPCQDLSLAGIGAGLKGARSGTFWGFLRVIQELKSDQEPKELSFCKMPGIKAVSLSTEKSSYMIILDRENLGINFEEEDIKELFAF